MDSIRFETGSNRTPHPRHRGSAYVMVLAVSLMITFLGVSSIAVARIKTAATTRANQFLEAQLLAFSAVEQALTILKNTPSWRSVYQHNVDTPAVHLGNGTCRWRLIDPTDTNLADDPTDPFYLQGAGTVGDCTYKLRIRVTSPTGSTLSADTASWSRVTD